MMHGPITIRSYRAVEVLGVETIAITSKRRNKRANLRTGTLRGNQSVIQYRVGRSDLQENKWD